MLYAVPSKGARKQAMNIIRKDDMTRNLKALGAVFAALLATAAMAASASAAVEFHSEKEHTILTGTQEGTNSFTVNAGTTHCTSAKFEGTQQAKTATSIDITPLYTGCKLTAFGGESLNATVDHNGCTYRFTSDDKVQHLICPTGKSIQVTAPFCTVTVSPQTFEGVTFKTVNKGSTTSEITVEANVNGLAYTQSAFCPTGGGTFANGVYDGDVIVTGENTAATEHIGIWYE
jgi:hypothetical protein